MRFEDLTEIQRELVAEAYRAQQVQRMRALIGVPVCVACASLAAWFFIVSDESGYGGALGWPIVVVLGGVACWMLAETIAERRLRWAIRSFNLVPEAEREVLASLKHAPALADERRRARGEIKGELSEGARRAATRDWWGTRRR